MSFTENQMFYVSCFFLVCQISIAIYITNMFDGLSWEYIFYKFFLWIFSILDSEIWLYK